MSEHTDVQTVVGSGGSPMVLEEAGVRIVQQGVLDVPPWPDTVMPAAEVLSPFERKYRASGHTLYSVVVPSSSSGVNRATPVRLL